MKCPIYDIVNYEMSFYEISFYEMSFYEIVFLWNVFEMSQRRYYIVRTDEDQPRPTYIFYKMWN